MSLEPTNAVVASHTEKTPDALATATHPGTASVVVVY